MKNKFKNYLKLGILLFGISFTLTNCEKDDTHSINISNNETLRIENISLSTFKNKKAVFQKINKLTANNNNKLNRTIYDSENDFYINTDEVVLIEKDGFHWLTFSIKRNSNSTGLENLVLRQNITNNTYLAYLAKYAISDNEINTIRNGGTVNDIENKVTFQSLISFNSDIFARDRIIHQRPDGSCFSYGTTIYGDNDEVIGMTEIHVECPEYLTSDTGNGDGGGGGGGSADNTPDDGCSTCPDYEGIPIDNTGTGSDNLITGPSGTASGDTTTIETDNNSENTECLTSDINGNCLNILTKPKPEPVDPHINYLTRLTNNPIIKQKLDELAPKIFSLPANNFKEDGARFNRIAPNSYIMRSPSATYPHKTSYTPAYQNNETVSTHIHQQLTYQMINGIIQFDADGNPKYDTNGSLYSDGDILEFLDNIEYIESTDATLTNEVASLLMSQAGIFALVVDDKTKALAAQNALINNDTYKQFTDDFKDNILKSSSNCGDSCFKRRLKKFIKNVEVNGQNLGISIYFSTLTPNQNNTVTINGWVNL
ncbi:MAG: hypothetical protein ACPG45_10990 [Flavobacteriaceae bacterium]